jgi:hypothetical protein
MGLLDDAIREHLELKRRHGGDPGETARQEQDALGSPHGEVRLDEHASAPRVEEGADAEPSRAAYEQNLTHTGEETAELDMRTVLDAGHTDRPNPASRPAESQPVGPNASAASPSGPTDAPASREGPAEDSLEWEMPGDQHGDRQGDSRRGESAAGADHSEESVEDVLEETPDFLRETPDQERLWFEQQPPRDFDFDK